MNNYSKFLHEQTKYQRESNYKKTQRLVEEWEPTQLLEGLSESDRHKLAQLLQNQAMDLVTESTKTGTTPNAENWEGIALPMVRKIFVEQLAKQLVHTQALDRPSGYVFYLDFKIENDRPDASPIYNANESVYGTTEGENDPQGGFYGKTRYSYTMNYQQASLPESSAPEDATLRDVQYDANLVEKVNAGDIKKATFALGGLEDEVDTLGLETFIFEDPAGLVTNVYREYTTLDGANLTFFYETDEADPTAIAEAVLQYTGQPSPNSRGDFEVGQSGVGAIPEAKMDVTKKEITAKTRKLKTVITPEIIQDLDAYHSVDTQKEMADFVTKYVNQEEDTEILNMLSRAARPITRYWSAMPGRYVDSKTGEIDNDQPSYTLGPADWYRTLGIRVRDISNELLTRNLRGGANWMVCSPKVATILESFNTFAVTQDNEMTYGMGTKQVGTLDGSIKIYKNPYYSTNEILLGFKGSNFLETGATYGQFVPVQLTPPITDPDDYTVKQGLMTRNAKVVVRSDYYARIIVRDINVV